MKKLRATLRRFTKAVGSFFKLIKRDIAAMSPVRLAEELLLLVIILQVAIVGINTINTGKPVLGLRFEGQTVGQLYSNDFRGQADALIQKRENQPLTVQVADHKSSITLRQLGVKANEKQVYNQLLHAGRTGNVLERLTYQDAAAMGRQNISLANQNFNVKAATAYIATLDQKTHIAPKNAHFTYQDPAVVITPDAKGRAVDTEAALKALQHADPAYSTQVILPTKLTTAPLTTGLLEPLLPQVQSIAQKPLTIAAGDSRTTLSPEQLVGIIVPKVVTDPKDPKKVSAQISFDEGKLNAVIDEVLQRVVVAPQSTIMSGDTVVRQGKPGVEAADKESLTRVLAALIQRQTKSGAPDEASIPLVTVEPSVVQQRVSNPSVNIRSGTGGVRLTFDDGPGGYTDQVLDVLKRYNARATFYVVGRNVERYPGTMQRMRDEGHRIGNHSYTHADMAYLSRAGVMQELTSTQAAIQRTTGVTPTGFRPPYMSYNGTVRDAVSSLGMSMDLWSVDTRDWTLPGSGVIAQRALAGVGPGAVILMHSLNAQTVNALPAIIEGIRSHGYTIE